VFYPYKKILISVGLLFMGVACAQNKLLYNDEPIILEAGHASLQEWLLPKTVPSPKDNKLTLGRAKLGEKLFFDPRLNTTGQPSVSCVSCHLPERGWSDGQPVAMLLNGGKLNRASPVITNTGFNPIQMWDGAFKKFEDHIITDLDAGSKLNGVKNIKNLKGYQELFEINYPDEEISSTTIAKAIASYQRTVVSDNSPFDQWVKGDAKAMTEQQIEGFRVFLDPEKGNCAVCHEAPNFTDSGFHNLGLASYGEKDHDVGRYQFKKIKIMDGAFKTPTLRDTDLSAPYFHDGSASTLMDVMEHYSKGGEVKTNLSPNFEANELTQAEKQSLVAFMHALTTDHDIYRYPELPQE
jgi:cytochrome c peroxidase